MYYVGLCIINLNKPEMHLDTVFPFFLLPGVYSKNIQGDQKCLLQCKQQKVNFVMNSPQ